MHIQRDGNDQPYIQWVQAGGHQKRAWIQRKADEGKNWAGAERYLNVVRCNENGNPSGNPTDFPIFNDLSDEQILRAFVQSTCAITGCSLPSEAK
ncbi:MAG TPA: hypothetical protein VGC86_12815 [Afipia sp.]